MVVNKKAYDPKNIKKWSGKSVQRIGASVQYHPLLLGPSASVGWSRDRLEGITRSKESIAKALDPMMDNILKHYAEHGDIDNAIKTTLTDYYKGAKGAEETIDGVVR